MSGALTRYPTFDLNLGGFLLAKNMELLGVERHGPRAAFVFESRAAEIVHEFYEDAPIPAKTYAECLSALKRVLHREGAR